MKNVLIIIVVAVLVLVGYRTITLMSTDRSISPAAVVTSAPISADGFEDIPPSYVDNEPVVIPAATSTPEITVAASTPQPAAARFSCDGRQHCSQMTSCAEATYFIQHCPNTKMDGNNDGIPCEQQWCK